MSESENEKIKQLQEEVELLKRELEIALILNSKISMDMDFDKLIDEVISTLRDKVNFDGCNFSIIDEHGYMKVHKVGHSKLSKRNKATKEFLEKIYSQRIDYTISREWASRVANEDIEFHYPEVNLEEFTPDERYLLENYGITSFYYLPLKSNNKIFGTMRFHNYGGTMHLSDFEKGLIRKRTAIVARALENHQLYNELKRKNRIIQLDMNLAKRIQQNLIPQEIPQFKNIEIAAQYIPMQEVGGDYYDFIYKKNEKEDGFGVIITDASGHGVPAAFITSMMKITFQGEKVLNNLDNPVAVINEINGAIRGKIADNFVSGLYCYFDFQNMVMKTARCGHSPVMKIDRKEGTIGSIGAKGGLLGLFEDPEVEEAVSPLIKGTRFFLYTDGLMDATNRDGDFFNNLLDDFCIEYKDLTAEIFAEKLIDDLYKFAIFGNKESLDDDTAIVVIDVL